MDDKVLERLRKVARLVKRSKRWEDRRLLYEMYRDARRRYRTKVWEARRRDRARAATAKKQEVRKAFQQVAGLIMGGPVVPILECCLSIILVIVVMIATFCGILYVLPKDERIVYRMLPCYDDNYNVTGFL